MVYILNEKYCRHHAVKRCYSVCVAAVCTEIAATFRTDLVWYTAAPKLN